MAAHCPNCRFERLQAAEFHGESVDLCGRCGGMWFDDGELDRSLSTADNGHDKVNLESSLGDFIGYDQRACPKCRSKLGRFYLLNGLEMEVQRCLDCSGTWVEQEARAVVVDTPNAAEFLTQLQGKLGIGAWLFQFLLKLPLETNLKPKGRPWVTWALIVLNVFMFACYQLQVDWLAPYQAELPLTPALLMQGEQPWSLLTYMFLHGGYLHIIGNMYFLYIIGDNLEDVLGRTRYLLLYLLCGMVAAFAQVAADPSSTTPIVGASGAIAGLFGMYMLWFRNAKLSFMLLIVQLRLPVQWYFIIWLGMNVWGLMQAGVGVAYWAHIGGFVAGLVVGWRYRESVFASNPMVALLHQGTLRWRRDARQSK